MNSKAKAFQRRINAMHQAEQVAQPPEQEATPRAKTITVDYDTWLTAVEVSAHNVDLGACLTRIVRDLPTQRDWLDPEVERWARQLTNTPALTEPEAK